MTDMIEKPKQSGYPDAKGNLDVTEACVYEPGMIVEYNGISMTYEQMVAMMAQEAKQVA